MYVLWSIMVLRIYKNMNLGNKEKEKNVKKLNIINWLPHNNYKIVSLIKNLCNSS